MTAQHVFRREKTTPHENQMHVLKWGGVIFLLLAFVLPFVLRVSEEIQMPAVPITADFTVADVGGEHMVDYEAKPTWSLRAHFIVQTRDMDGHVMCTHRSTKPWPYDPGSVASEPWHWEAWVEGGCPLPDGSFHVCLRYEGEGVHGTAFSTPYQCRGPFLGADE